MHFTVHPIHVQNETSFHTALILESTPLSWLIKKKNNVPHWGSVVVFTIYVFVGFIRSALVLFLLLPSGYFSDTIVVRAMKSKNMFLVL